MFDGAFGIFTIGQTEATPVTLSALSMDAEFPFTDFRDTPKINASGETAFFASIPGPGEFGFVQGVFSTGSGELQQVAIEGAQVPGAEPGVVFGFNLSYRNEVLLNDAGQTAFVSYLTDANLEFQTAIFRERSGDLELVARTGDQVPRAEDGLLFYNLNFDLEFNAAGQVAFLALLTTDQVIQSHRAIFATDLDGQLIEVVRSGDLIDVNDDPMVEDLREVRFLRFSEDNSSIGGMRFSNGGRSSSGFNDSGQLAFIAEFADGSQAVLVSNRAVFDEFLLGDVDGNGAVDFDDIGPFITILSTDAFLDQADTNRDEKVDFSDIAPFINILAGS